MHEGVSSLGIPKGGGAKNSDLLTSEVRKTRLVCALAEQTELQRYDYCMKLGCAAYLELP